MSGVHAHRFFQCLVCFQPVGGVGVVALVAFISGDAEHGGADSLPGPLRQGDGGKGLAVPGVHRGGVVN